MLERLSPVSHIHDAGGRIKYAQCCGDGHWGVLIQADKKLGADKYCWQQAYQVMDDHRAATECSEQPAIGLFTHIAYHVDACDLAHLQVPWSTCTLRVTGLAPLRPHLDIR